MFVNKTNFIHFQTTHANNILQYNIKVDDLPLNKQDTTKFLGVTIDKNLNWNQHINNISTSVAKGIGILHRIKYFVSKKVLITLYNTLILPYISYCNMVWGNCCVTKLNQILFLQKKAIRICSNSLYLAHTNPLFHHLKFLKVFDINKLQTAIFMFKYCKGILPPVFNSFFALNKALHSYPTRTCNNIHVNNPKMLLAHRSLRHHGPDIWNNLPDYTKQITFLNSFKRIIKQILLDQYT